MKKKKVVVTTGKRGVFFGELVSGDIATGLCKLINAQMCIYWSAETNGVLGLASHGPQVGSKVTPVIPAIELNDVTAIMDCSDEAVKQWASQILS